MKRTLLLLSIALTPLYAFGDFSPGRVRASAAADVTRVQGIGRYENVQSAHVVQLQTDGKGITGFTISLDHAADLALSVKSIHPTRCGRTFVAGVPGAELRIDETSPAACGRQGSLGWHVTLTTDDGNDKSSYVILQGTPVYFLLTQ